MKHQAQVGVGVFIDDKLVAFCLNELIEPEYVVAHVLKADISIAGVYAFLMKKNAEELYFLGKKYEIS